MLIKIWQANVEILYSLVLPYLTSRKQCWLRGRVGVQLHRNPSLTTTEKIITCNVTPIFCISIVFSFSWELKCPQEWQTKSIMICYGIFCSGQTSRGQRVKREHLGTRLDLVDLGWMFQVCSHPQFVVQFDCVILWVTVKIENRVIVINF